MNQINNELKELVKSFIGKIIVNCIELSDINLISEKNIEYSTNVQYYYRFKINDMFKTNQFLINDNKKLNNKDISLYLNKNNSLIEQIMNSKKDIENLIIEFQNNIDEIYLIYKKRGYIWRM